MERRYGGITLGGIIVIVGIVLIFIWSFWIGLIVALIVGSGCSLGYILARTGAWINGAGGAQLAPGFKIEFATLALGVGGTRPPAIGAF